MNFISHLHNYLNFYKNHPQLCHKQLQILKGGSDINIILDNIDTLKQRIDTLDTKWEKINGESGTYKIGDIIQINDYDGLMDELYEKDLKYGIVIDTNYNSEFINILDINIYNYSLTKSEVWKGTSIAKLKDNFKNYTFSELYKNIDNHISNSSLFLFQLSQPSQSSTDEIIPIMPIIGKINSFVPARDVGEVGEIEIVNLLYPNFSLISKNKKEFEKNIKSIQKISFDEGKDIISFVSYIKSRIRFLNNPPDDNASDSGMSNVYPNNPPIASDDSGMSNLYD